MAQRQMNEMSENPCAMTIDRLDRKKITELVWCCLLYGCSYLTVFTTGNLQGATIDLHWMQLAIFIRFSK